MMSYVGLVKQFIYEKGLTYSILLKNIALGNFLLSNITIE